IVFVSGLLIVSLLSNSFTTSAFGQHARLMGKNEIPPVNTPATGTANFNLNPDTNSFPNQTRRQYWERGPEWNAQGYINDNNGQERSAYYHYY
ncbi:MAG TPA: hypothetical protein VN922_05795, partial [Bacteroidia bacterium]|nr:hypothetical protein [Bacteroidia bacterium]